MSKNNIGTVTDRLLAEFGSKPMTIRTEAGALVIRANGQESRFVGWQDMNLEEIIGTVRGEIRESVNQRVLING